MSKRKRSVQRWQVCRIRGSRNEYIDSVLASDAESAIQAVIQENEIIDPEKQRRLVAYPEGD